MDPPPLLRQTLGPAIGVPVLGYPAADPAAVDSSTPPPALEEGVTSEGEAVHIVIDQSASMRDMGKEAFLGACEVVENLDPDTAISVTTFAAEVHLGQRASQQVALEQLRAPRVANGMTSLNDALVEVVRAELRAPRQQMTVVVVSDGLDTKSRRSAVEARAAVTQLNDRPGCRVLFLGTNMDALAVGAAYGVHAQHALTFDGSRVQQALRSVSETMRSPSGGFTPLQRQASMSTDFGGAAQQRRDQLVGGPLPRRAESLRLG